MDDDAGFVEVDCKQPEPHCGIGLPDFPGLSGVEGYGQVNQSF